MTVSELTAPGAASNPVRGLVYVFMISRDKLSPNPDNSAMRRAYQDAVAAALAQP